MKTFSLSKKFEQKLKQMSILDRYIYFVNEREKIKVSKDMGRKQPWTDDEILNTFRFCNMVRIEDRVSQWLMKNWYEPNFNHPNMLIACCLARYINLPETLDAIGFPKVWEPKRVARILLDLQDAGHKIFHPAYMFKAEGRGTKKAESVVFSYIESIKDFKINPSSMQKTHAIISKGYGFGSFMAGQVMADLRWAVKGNWFDKNVWAPIGPGSQRGMQRLFSIAKPISQEYFVEKLSELINYKEVKNNISVPLYVRMEAMDWQNSLCEFDKYERTLHGEGRPKCLYKPYGTN